MSWLPCSYCHDWADTDGDGHWDVPTITGRKLEFVCGACGEKYLDEGGVFNPELEESA